MSKWSREQVIVAFYLYVKHSGAYINKKDQEIIDIANLIGRTPDAISFKLGNIRYIDSNGAHGYENYAKEDERVYDEFNGKYTELSIAANDILNNLPKLLRASHIKPWKKSDDNEKTNPCNGLCLNGLHDLAFDQGLMTIDSSTLKVIYSPNLKNLVADTTTLDWFMSFDGKQITMPMKNPPAKDFLDWHNNYFRSKL